MKKTPLYKEDVFNFLFYITAISIIIGIPVSIFVDIKNNQIRHAYWSGCLRNAPFYMPDGKKPCYSQADDYLKE